MDCPCSCLESPPSYSWSCSASLVYAVVRFRNRTDDDNREPPQVYGSNQVELAWTVIPVLIVVALFMASARVIATIQNAERPANAIEVVAIGHQFWWEYRYPGLNVVTANELHVPVSDPANPTPTFITLLSADMDHSFWVPRLAGKTDLIPNRTNHTWIDPHEAGLYLGQCAQYCGTQHAKMLLRVYVQPRAEFDRWIQEQQQQAVTNQAVSEGRHVFESTACVNCHTVSGTRGQRPLRSGSHAPDESRHHRVGRCGQHSRESAAVDSRILTPSSPGARMPAMGLSERELEAVVAYLETLR